LGLWPSRSLELLGSIAQSHYMVKGNSIFSKDLDLLAMRLSQACDTRIERTTIAPGATDDKSLTELAKIGAWRFLTRQYEGE